MPNRSHLLKVFLESVMRFQKIISDVLEQQHHRTELLCRQTLKFSRLSGECSSRIRYCFPASPKSYWKLVCLSINLVVHGRSLAIARPPRTESPDGNTFAPNDYKGYHQENFPNTYISLSDREQDLDFANTALYIERSNGLQRNYSMRNAARNLDTLTATCLSISRH